VIAEVLGRPGHAHYRVLWNDGRESIHYPADGTRIRRTATDPLTRKAARSDPRSGAAPRRA
jgi:hypothetical protein